MHDGSGINYRFIIILCGGSTSQTEKNLYITGLTKLASYSTFIRPVFGSAHMRSIKKDKRARD
jgi:hypothetical protein